MKRKNALLQGELINLSVLLKWAMCFLKAVIKKKKKKTLPIGQSSPREISDSSLVASEKAVLEIAWQFWDPEVAQTGAKIHS